MLVTKLNTVGKDWYIRKLQEHIYAKLVALWGEDVVYDCYGRVYRNKTSDGYKAEVYKGKKEYSDIYWDDSKQVISFFGVSPNEQISEDAEVDVHLVFFVNLDFKSATKRNDEEIRRDVYSILKKDPFGFQLKESHTGIENCLTEYPGTSRDQRLKFFDMHPGHVFRFDMTLRYDPDMEYETTEEEPVEDSEGLSSGGSIITSDADAIGTADPTPSGRFYTVTLHNVRSTTMSFYFDKKASVDWGDGSDVKQYPGDRVVNKVYNAIGDDPIEIKVWWEVEALNPCRVIYVQSGGSTPNTAIVDSISGDGPTNLWRFQVSNGLTVFPFDLIPNSITYVNVNQCSFDADTLNDIMQMFIDKNVTRGLLKIQQNPAVPGIDQNIRQAVEDLGNTVYYDS